MHTPEYVAKYIYESVKKHQLKNILDVGCFDGSLSKYFKKKHNGYVIGVDIIKDYSNNFDNFLHIDFLEATKKDFEGIKVDLVVTNPPFGVNKKYGKLYPHLFLEKIHDLFGKQIPVIMIVGHWFTTNSNERIELLKNCNVTKVVTLHKNTFKSSNVSVESEIIYFNIKQKKSIDFLEYKQKEKKVQKFKTVALNKAQIEFIQKHIKNFSGEVKQLLHKKYKDFPT